MSDGLTQITIPDFDDDDLHSTSIPFGRPTGFSFGASSGQESPTHSTPLAERSFFHARGDSVTSEDSNISFQQTPTRTNGPFIHSSQSSVATTSSSFTKKSSFASIRNAFKSGKTSEPPPVPHIDRQAYPALKNPFSRSTSSLAHAPAQAIRRPSVTASPPHPRPPTPGAGGNDFRHVRSKSRGHAYGRSQHSHTGSYFQYSDNGSDHSHGLHHVTPPPPVPRVPDGFGGHACRAGTPPLLDMEEKVVMDPRTPSDYALHAVFMRFATAAEVKIDAFLRQGLDRDPVLSDFMGPNIDPKFDDVLHSLGRIAMKHTKPVIDSIMRWRRSQNESLSGDVIRQHSSTSYAMGRGTRPQDVVVILNERKSLASIYVMCRALIVVMQSISKDALGEAIGLSLEETTFDQFKRPDLKLLAQSANHRTNADLYATLLGHISNLRFVNVTDRFLSELGPLALGQVPKDLDMKYESLVKGLRHVQIKVWPPESFEEGAEFLESLSKSFENAHGLRLKTTFAETLVHLLHPIGKTAQAEVNHPLWAKAIERIYPRARDMMTKPRYWHVAYPLVVTSLCVAPHEYFLRHWISCFEAGLAKLKEKPCRIPVMNGMMRLVWTYLYRCHEPTSTSTSKLETLLKYFFPSNRTSINPPDDHLDPFVYIVHFILSRHFEFGCDLTLTLMQEQPIRASQSSNIVGLLAPERTNIALEAILLSLHLVEREESAPAWPSNSDFSVVPNKEDYPSSSDLCPPSFMSKPGMQEFFDRCGSTVRAIAYACASSVGRMSIFDDQWSLSRLNAAYDEATNFVIQQHAEANVAYPSNLTAQITVLHTCFTSWPRCLHPSLPLDDALEMLLHGVIHVEPAVGDAASLALKRFASEPTFVNNVLSRFAVFLFSPKQLSGETSHTRLAVESSRLLAAWFAAVDIWAAALVQKAREPFEESEINTVVSKLQEIEIGVLFLLSFNSPSVRSVAVKVIRVLEAIHPHLSIPLQSPSLHGTARAFRVVDLLLGKGVSRAYLDENHELLDHSQRARLVQWQQLTHTDVILRLADSNDERDRSLWRFVLPAFIRSSMDHQSDIITACREAWNAAVSRYHPLIAIVSGINNRLPTPQVARSPALLTRDRDRNIIDNISIIEQWHMWVKLVCCTASGTESRPSTKREHSRAPSEVMYERDRIMTTRGLFRYLTPFLDSDYSIFRDTAVMCISSFPPNGYSQLLEDLSAFAARHFYDDSRTKISSPSTRRNRRQDRLYLAVAHIYQLTAHLLKEQRGIGRQDSLTNVLTFVRHTQAFLGSAEIRGDWQQQRLRRYFCGIVEHLFDGLATLQASDRFIPHNMHLTLYRLCEEWCQCGYQSPAIKQRLISMQTAATAGFVEPQLKAAAIEKFQTETVLLSHAAVGAMASLCQRAFFPPEMSSGSPSDRPSVEFLVPLEVVATLDRIVSMLASIHQQVNDSGRKALRSLLSHRGDDAFVDDVLRRSFVSSKEANTSNYRFFEIVASVVCNADVHPFSFGHVVCFGMVNLCSPLKETRRQAFNALEAAHIKAGGRSPLSQFEAGASSSAPNVYLDAQYRISEYLSHCHPAETGNVLAQCSAQLPLAQEILSPFASARVLNSLVPWMSDIQLMMDDMSNLSREGQFVLYHLMALTLRHSETHPEQIQSLWGQLVAPQHSHNGQATVRFLLEQSSKIGSSVFVNCAKQIVACLSRTHIGRQIFEDLCEVIEPARMLPNIDHRLMFPDADETDLWSDLDALFAEQPRHTLGAGQFAMLFLADVVPMRAWECENQLPTLLHAIFAHIDHRNPLLRDHARMMLFQTLRSWLPGYDELANGAVHPSYLSLKAAIANLERDSAATFWMEEDPISETSRKMKQLCSSVVEWLGPLHPSLVDEWGSLALLWGTACSIRTIAFRSLQIFRALTPRVAQCDLALLLGRLTNTIAGPDSNIQSFTAEIILTLNYLANAGNLDSSLLPTMFWCAYACLSSPIESEFGQIVNFLDCLLDSLDLDDPYTKEVLLAHKPSNWLDGIAGLQPLLLPGMRSVVTYKQTFKVLKRLARLRNSAFVDPSGNRVRDLYTLCLPWCLRAMEDNNMDEDLVEFANDVGQLAEEDGQHSIVRILTSFVKSRFRTKDDFLRQAAAALREHYAPQHWTEVVSLLLGLVLNQERWLRIKSIQILKVVFQLRETRHPVDRLGSELLMPLLRLLQTDLASKALEVLEEPMAISGGPTAKQVLRMSMHISATQTDAEDVTEVFGMPEESGWCIAKPDRKRDICRANVMAVFDTCKMPSRPSRIEFHPEVEVDTFTPPDSSDPLGADLGDLVQNLHELSTFFQDDQPKPSLPVMPSHQLEARVAAILAKSTENAMAMDSPQTPFVDVFRIGGREYDDSDDDSDSDYDTDTFGYDHFANGQTINERNGFSDYHRR